MKILFLMRSTVYVRNFESTLRLLAARGHDVEVVADWHPLSSGILDGISRDCPAVHHSLPPIPPFNGWSFLGLELRRALDYLRYLNPEYAAASKLRTRAEDVAPAFVLKWLEHPLVRSAAGRSLLARLLRWCDRAVPRDPAIDEFVRQRDPDLVLVTPLVEPGSPQSEFLRAARALGVRTGLCVYSWDNLTNKGLIHEPLDLVTVWNEPMRREALTLHHVPAQRVVVTGAAAYDHWFTWQPRTSREAFCHSVGLQPGRPYLLYLCSSKFIARHEAPYVRGWVTRLRAASPALRDVGVLVRPHPQNMAPWETEDLADLDNVTIWPRAGANPVDDESRAEYYDSIFHSAAVVGVNTSAQIESAIVGRGVYTLLADDFRETQEGTLHFQHLRDVNGGLLHVARDFAEHAAQLERAIAAPPDDERCRKFVEAFVRPYGVDVPGAPRLVAAIESVGARGRTRPDGGPWWRRLARPALARAARRLSGTRRARKAKAARGERLEERRTAERAALQTRRVAVKRELEAARERRKLEAQANRDAVRLAREQLSRSAYDRYCLVRDHARQMADGCGYPALTTGERAMLSSLAHLWTATPDEIRTLRRQCAPISGVSPSVYDEVPEALRRRLGHEHYVLRRQIAPDLIVDEPAVLGGFGCGKRGARYNEDTVRYMKAVAALQDGGVLGGFRRSPHRRLVWEIGGGWGGFAYQFKTLCPNVTYVITGLPDLFLVSAVYLLAVFPRARVRFLSPGQSSEALWQNWEEADFVFVPESRLDVFHPPRLDLVLDIMSLRTMTAERVDEHVRRAHDLGAGFFYSLLPSDSRDQDGARVWAPIGRRYWPHPVPPRVDRIPNVINLDGAPALESDCAHLVGVEAAPRMKRTPRIVFGMAAYGRADAIGQTLESLLGQTRGDLAIVIVDDQPTPEVRAIVDAYAAVDERVHYQPNPQRRGMIGNWQYAYRRSRELFPESEYFAWASDHDIWHPRWVEVLAGVLDTQPQVVMAYPQVMRVYRKYRRRVNARLVSITGSGREERMKAAATTMTAGNAIYGLFRANAFERAGVFRPVLLPDRQQLVELALYGEIIQVPEILWYREVAGAFSYDRQRRMFFADRAPLHTRLPVNVQHAAVLLWDLAVIGRGRPEFGRLAGARYAAVHLWHTTRRALTRSIGEPRPDRARGGARRAAPPAAAGADSADIASDNRVNTGV